MLGELKLIKHKIDHLNNIYRDTQIVYDNFFNDKLKVDGFIVITHQIIELCQGGFLCKMLSKEDILVNHLVNVAIMSNEIAKYCNLSETETFDLLLASLMHDIGKNVIPHNILNQKGELSFRQKQFVKGHAHLGKILLNNLNINDNVLNIIEQHHSYIETIDNPVNLKNMENHNSQQSILICSIADISDAILSKRAYKCSMSLKVAQTDLLNRGILDIEDVFIAIGLV